jgi:uncharacterized membrane protein
MQNPPPNQPGYGGYGPPQNAPYGSSPYASLGKSALGNMDANAAGALAYITLMGIILIIVEKENRFVRFHAMQSLLYSVGLSVFMMLFLILIWTIGFVLMLVGIGAGAGGEAGGAIAIVIWLVIMLIWIAAIIIMPLLMLGGLIYAAVKAYHGQMFRLPIVGSLAEKITRQ